MDEPTVTVSLYTVQQNGILPLNRCPVHWTTRAGTFCKARKNLHKQLGKLHTVIQTNTWCLLLQACRRNAALLKSVQSYKTGLKSVGRRGNKTEVLFCFVFLSCVFVGLRRPATAPVNSLRDPVSVPSTLGIMGTKLCLKGASMLMFFLKLNNWIF